MPSIVQPATFLRTLYLYLLVDFSGSNAHGGKIGAINYALREIADPLRELAGKNPQMEMKIQAYGFGGSTSRLFPDAVSPTDYRWNDVAATGLTPMGGAFRLVLEDYQGVPADTPCYAPVLVLVSDGMPNDDWEQHLDALNQNYWAKKANRVAVAIGSDCDRSVLQRFLGSSEFGILEATSPDQILNAIVTATLRASQASALAGREAVSGSSTGSTGDRGKSQKSLLPEAPRDSIPPSILDNASVENARW